MPRYQGQPFSCVNPRGRFHTDVSGQRKPTYPHNRPNLPPSPTLGSALDRPLIVNPDGGSLWLEHVVDTNGGWDPFWFMWYSNNGVPRLTMSGAFDINQLRNLSEALSTFLETC